MKSRSLAKCAFEIAMRSMMGVTCSARDRGWLSLNHRVALNLERNQTGPTERRRSSCIIVAEFRASDINLACSHGSVSLLDFTGKLDGTADVATVQVELRVEVFLRCDGRGVVRTGALRHVTLTKERKKMLSRMMINRGRRLLEKEKGWILPRCKLYVVQQSPEKTAEESYSLRGDWK